MSQEITLAFAHPEDRSHATSNGVMRDRISVRDYITEVEIGAFQQERGTTQRVCFNVVVEVVHHTDQLDDDVDRILSYDKVTEAIDGELSSERLNLLETLAERIAERILFEPQAMRAFVRIEKLDRGPGALGVEIVREKAALGSVAIVEESLEPIVLFFTNEAIKSGFIATWLDAAQARRRPVVICVDAPTETPPISGAPLAQRRIDLLAIEQNAWVLAGRDPRCVVVETRTEMDWAMKHDQICVWAPSKMVLDAVDGPDADAQLALEITVWFAKQMHASLLVCVGQTAQARFDAQLTRHIPVQEALF